jgi:heat shock protein HslJ
MLKTISNSISMKPFKNTLKVTAAVLLLAAVGCKPKGAETQDPAAGESTAEPAMSAAPVPDAHNSQNSLDWNGTYKGVVPCADCEGIETVITLMKDGEFRRRMTYLGKEETGRTDTGSFAWDETGSKVTLTPEEGEPQSYQVGENALFHLDREGNRITGDLAEKYILVKNLADPGLENKKWILVELMGQEITAGEGRRTANLMFDSETGRFSGNNSCNVINGGYELKEGNRITFGKMASTLMACPDMETADRFNKVLETADNYTIAEGVLSLNKARMAPLARFRLEE